MKILIVDDEMAIGKVLDTVFSNKGYETKWISSAENISKEVEEFKPDLVLLDVNMPGKSGFEALREIRQNSNIPVIMITVLSQEFNIDKAYELGAVDYVVKPFSIQHLVRKVEAVLGDK